METADGKRCLEGQRTDSSTAEPPPFKRRDAGSSPARCMGSWNKRPGGGTRQTRGSQKPFRQRVQVRVLPGACVCNLKSQISDFGRAELRKLNRTERRPPKPEGEGSSPSRNVGGVAMSSKGSSSWSAEPEG